MAHVAGLDPKPDIVLATGDLVDGGKPEEYALLRRLLAPLAMPVYLIPGNHDARDAMREGFPDHTYLPRTGFLHYTIENLPVRLIALDTLIPGKAMASCAPSGSTGSRRGSAKAIGRRSSSCTIRRSTAASTSSTVIGLLEGGARLAELVRRHGDVERVMCGHVHRPIQVRWAGTMASIAPSTAHQATLDLKEGAPLSMKMEPPGMALHLWRPGTGLITHMSFIGTYDGPRPFRST